MLPALQMPFPVRVPQAAERFVMARALPAFLRRRLVMLRQRMQLFVSDFERVVM